MTDTFLAEILIFGPIILFATVRMPFVALRIAREVRS